MKKLFITIFVALCMHANADVLQLREDHPQRYVVVKGDTLWDISAKFLKSPWKWPDIWAANQYIENPHLIYPGDVLVLVYRDGAPQLILERNQVVKLSPSIREGEVDNAIPALALDVIRPFLSNNTILTNEHDVMGSPYVVAGSEGRIISGAGDIVFAKGRFDDSCRFNIYRKGQVFVDPETTEVLGYEMLYIGTANRTAFQGEIATLAVIKTAEEIRLGDHVLPNAEAEIIASYYPKSPASVVNGRILAVEDGVTQIGLHSIVIINKGTREGIALGDVLAVQRQGNTVKDPYTHELIQLPPVRGGIVMIVKTFDKLSYGLVMESTQPLEVGDGVINP